MVPTVIAAPKRQRSSSSATEDLIPHALKAVLSPGAAPIGVPADTWVAWRLGTTLLKHLPDERAYGGYLIPHLARDLHAILGTPWQRSLVYGALKLAETFTEPEGIPKGLHYAAFKPPKKVFKAISEGRYVPWDPWAMKDPQAAAPDDPRDSSNRLWPRQTLLLQIADGIADASDGRITVTSCHPTDVAQGCIALKDIGPIDHAVLPRTLWMGLCCERFPQAVEDRLGGSQLLHRLQQRCNQSQKHLRDHLTMPLIVELTDSRLQLRIHGETSHPQGWPRPKKIQQAIARRWPRF